MQQVEDPELKKLAEDLPGTIVGSRADSTVKKIKKYLRAFQRWKGWASRYAAEIAVYPVKVAGYRFNEIHDFARGYFFLSQVYLCRRSCSVRFVCL